METISQKPFYKFKPNNSSTNDARVIKHLPIL